MSVFVVSIGLIIVSASVPPSWQEADVVLSDGRLFPAYVLTDDTTGKSAQVRFVPQMGKGRFHDFGGRLNRTLSMGCAGDAIPVLSNNQLRCPGAETPHIHPNITLPDDPLASPNSAVPPVQPWGRPVVQDPRFFGGWLLPVMLVIGLLFLMAWWAERRVKNEPFGPEAPSIPSWTRGAWAWCVAATTMALLLRLFGLGDEALEQNEFTYFMSGLGHDALGGVLLDVNALAQTHPPLFHVLLHWFGGLGNSEWVARLPAAIAGVTAVPLTFALAWRVLGGKTLPAVVAALLAVVSPVHLWYSQDVSPYTLTVVFSLVTLLSMDELLRAPERRRSWWGLILGTWGLFYSHYYGLHLTIGCFLVLLWTIGRRRPGWKALAYRSLAVGSIILVGIVVWLPAFVQAYLWSKGHSTVYQRDVGVYHPTSNLWGDLLDTLRLVGGFPNALRYVALAGVLLAAAHIRFPSLAPSRRLLLLVPLCWFIPFELINRETFLKSLYGGYYFGIRYLLFLFPIVWVLAAACVANVFRSGTARWLKWSTLAIASVALVAGATASVGQLTNTERPDIRSAAAHVRHHVQDGDAVVVGPAVFYQPPFHYYMATEDERDALRINDYMQTPAWHDGWVGVLSEFFEALPKTLQNVHIKRVWLIDHTQHLLGRAEFSERPSKRLATQIESTYEPVSGATKNFHDVSVRLYKRPSPPSLSEPLERIHFGWNDASFIRNFSPSWAYASPGRVIEHNSQVLVPIPTGQRMTRFRLRVGTVAPPNTTPDTHATTLDLRVNGQRVKTVQLDEQFQVVSADLGGAGATDRLDLRFGLQRPKPGAGRPVDIVVDWLAMDYLPEAK